MHHFLSHRDSFIVGNFYVVNYTERLTIKGLQMVSSLSYHHKLLLYKVCFNLRKILTTLSIEM
jgi:hypothetical protein